MIKIRKKTIFLAVTVLFVLPSFIHPTSSGVISDLGASIEDIREFDIIATVSGSGNAKILNAFVTVSG